MAVKWRQLLKPPGMRRKGSPVHTRGQYIFPCAGVRGYKILHADPTPPGGLRQVQRLQEPGTTCLEAARSLWRVETSHAREIFYLSNSNKSASLRRPPVRAAPWEPAARAPLHSSSDASPLNCVAPRSNMPNMLPRRALPDGRLAALGAARRFTTDSWTCNNRSVDAPLFDRRHRGVRLDRRDQAHLEEVQRILAEVNGVSERRRRWPRRRRGTPSRPVPAGRGRCRGPGAGTRSTRSSA